jgi:hypothetical protein
MNDESRLQLRTIVHQWERLRFIYNAVLLIEGLLLTADLMAVAGATVYWANVLVFGAIANAFYCLGPLVDVYLLAYGVKLLNGRYLLFGIGLLFSMAVVLWSSMWAAFVMLR